MRQSGGDPNRRLARWLLGYSEVLSSAFLMVLPAVVGIACDAWLRTAPWCLVVGAVVGLCLGLLRLTKMTGSATDGVRPQSGKLGGAKTAGLSCSPSPGDGEREVLEAEPGDGTVSPTEKAESLQTGARALGSPQIGGSGSGW